MSDYPIPADEQARLATLHELELLDTSAEPAFDRVTRLVSRLLEVPVALVTLIDAHRQWLKSRVGLDVESTPRSESVCNWTIDQRSPLVIEDLSQDPRFAHFSGVNRHDGLRFYAGIPLYNSAGVALGSLCAVDHQPRRIDAEQLATLEDLAAIINQEIQLRETNQRLATLVADHAETHRTLHARETELRLVIDTAYDAYIGLDGEGRVTDWNRAAGHMFGLSREAALGMSIDQLIGPLTLPFAGERSISEAMARRHDGHEIPVEVRMRAFELGADTHCSIFVHDITERRQLDALRDQEARQDVLTGLPNRRALDERLPEAMARVIRSGKPLALLFMDLDGFKAVNDDYGHDAGDALLREIARRLLDSVRKTDHVSRLAGDEFVVLLEGIDIIDAEAFAGKLVTLVEAPVALGEEVAEVSTSIGVAVHGPGDVRTAAALLKRADVAMYTAKRAGKARVHLAEDDDDS
ncbi:PAS domain S-box-containing protein/diguanylate cyclase (GGDEF) domain-containing protein [Franzmannia pantelleriensis]|uniref:PAS domain S-box-containing protein/diguanylate cyclase (GGDEF) domain-containing protein n=1 Tax=Franzmannia pantelleriensis TaxID=48727 RepID=A0A1G9I3W1_9GAMM|nr:diguanylate cyclase [Halomonas pantelleriensis]SDL19899.1 PAS domain S-box-containing protein/diguanylate cyclase (GGDEF) domain-containing protein [Halomonas pantelleriensis]